MLIPEKLKSLVNCVASKTTKYANEGVYIERQRVCCFAAVTDGKHLIEVRWDDADFRQHTEPGASTSPKKKKFSVVLDANHWREAFATITDGVVGLVEKPADTAIVSLATCEEGPGSDTLKRHHFDCPPAPGKFPKYREIIPKYDEEDSVTIDVDPRVLAKVLLVIADTATSDEHKKVHLTVPKDPTKAIRIEVDYPYDEITAIGVVMPMKP